MASFIVKSERLTKYRKIKPCHFCRQEISREGDAFKVKGTRGRTKYYHTGCAMRAGFVIRQSSL